MPSASKPDDMAGMDMSGDMAGMDMGQAPAAPPMSSRKAASMMHMAPEPALDLATTAVWGRTKSLADGSKENSYLLEALLRFASRNYVWTRMENAGRSNELLLQPGTALPVNYSELPLGHVAAFTLGYDRDYKLGKRVLAAPGAQCTVYRTPGALMSRYGSAPTAETFFVRFRLR